MKTLKLALSMGLFAAVAPFSAQATLLVTYAENPGEQNSTLSNTSVETFDSMTTGLHATANWIDPITSGTVGTFSNLDIRAADQYGGAGGNGKYAVTGVGVNTQTILNLTNASSYFGMWWSAGDAKNVLDFYSGANGSGTLLAEFTTTNLLAKLTPKTVYNDNGTGGYYGNPNFLNASGQAFKDTGEPFAFLNFFGLPGTAWSSIVITNNGSSGFEADNYTSRVAVFNPSSEGPVPGHVVELVSGTNAVAVNSYSFPSGGGLALAPEPSPAWAMWIVGGLSCGGTLLRRFRKQAA